MKRIASLLLFVLLFAPRSGAQIIQVRHENRFFHFVKTHKTVLILDSLVIMAQAADAASSVHCQAVSHKGCIETNDFLGKHPSNAATWGYSMGVAGTLTSLNHVFWWLTNKDDASDLRPLMFLWNVPLVVFQVFNVENNADSAEYLQNRNKRLPRTRLPHYR